MTEAERTLPIMEVVYQFPLDYMTQVTEAALQARDQVSQGARDSLNAAINNSDVRVDGFRDASKADAETLAEPVFVEISGANQKLVRSVLRAWSEAKQDLRAKVLEELEAIGVTTNGSVFNGDAEFGVWEKVDWRGRVSTIQAKLVDEDSLDVRLMMTCLSGMSPAPLAGEELKSKMFRAWFEELQELPPDAPEWDEAETFVRTVKEVAEEKWLDLDTWQAARLLEVVQGSQKEFAAELKYLEIDLERWSSDTEDYLPDVQQAIPIAETLYERLSDFSGLREMAATRSEEAARRVEREQCEASVMDVVKRWQNLIEESRLAAETRASGSAVEQASSESVVVPGAEEAELKSRVNALSAELAEYRKKHDKLKDEKEAWAAEREGLKQRESNLSEEIALLKEELNESQQSEKYWREQLVSASKATGVAKEDAPDEVRNVEDAVNRASSAFSKTLVISLNSKSDVDTDFQKPDEVYQALAWLATEYHRARTRELGQDPQFDKMLKEACSGWSYKPKQTNETKDQYRDWYYTRVGDKEYELDAHLGKGTSFDPQHTIRIAFDWDNEEKRVVVGFIGRHQKNRRS